MDEEAKVSAQAYADSGCKNCHNTVRPPAARSLPTLAPGWTKMASGGPKTSNTAPRKTPTAKWGRGEWPFLGFLRAPLSEPGVPPSVPHRAGRTAAAAHAPAPPRHRSAGLNEAAATVSREDEAPEVPEEAEVAGVPVLPGVGPISRPRTFPTTTPRLIIITRFSLPHHPRAEAPSLPALSPPPTKPRPMLSLCLSLSRPPALPSLSPQALPPSRAPCPAPSRRRTGRRGSRQRRTCPGRGSPAARTRWRRGDPRREAGGPPGGFVCLCECGEGGGGLGAGGGGARTRCAHASSGAAASGVCGGCLSPPYYCTLPRRFAATGRGANHFSS